MSAASSSAMSPSESLREFLRRPRSAQQLMMDAYIPPVPEGWNEDWIYWDMPGCISAEEWDTFIDLIGAKNYRILTFATRGDGKEKRGQFFLSPEGMRRMNAFVAHS